MVQYAPAPLLAMSGFGVMARRCFVHHRASRSHSIEETQATSAVYLTELNVSSLFAPFGLSFCCWRNAMQIANGLTMLEITATTMGRTTTICPTVLWDDQNVVLVDTGYPGQLSLFREALEHA